MRGETSTVPTNKRVRSAAQRKRGRASHLVPQREVEVAIQVAVRHRGGQRRAGLAPSGGEQHRAQGQSGQPPPLGWGKRGGAVRERSERNGEGSDMP